jgi:hypothetical protein
MTATASIEIVGLKEAIRSLNKIEPSLRKEFTAQANAIAQPAIQEAKNAYQRVPLSGMERKWSQNGKAIFPFTIAKAVAGVKLKVDAGRNAVSLIYITQTNVAAAVFEAAGRKTQNRLGDSLGLLEAGRTRLIGPAVYRKKNAIEREMEKAALATIARVQKELN